MLMFEDIFSIGDCIRAYDYAPDQVEGEELFAEGNIVEIVEFPCKSYRIHCQRDTFSKRVGEFINIPMQMASHEFNNRVILLPK
jgi:hypothetical protein